MAESGERRMLFDIRGRRRHVVRVVYAILALLMGGSLFLVIGPFSIADLFGTTGTESPAKVLNEQAERVEGKLRVEPDNPDLLLSLTRTRIAAGNAAAETDPETGGVSQTEEGLQNLLYASEAWDRYLAVTDEPNPSGALLMAGAYFALAETSRTLEATERNIDAAATTQRIAAEARPNVGSLTTLAIYEYFDGNFAAGDEAADKAEGKAPKTERGQVKKQLNEFRRRAKAFVKSKKEVAKTEGEQGREALQNPLGELGSSGSLGQ